VRKNVAAAAAPVAAAPAAADRFTVTVNGRAYEVAMDGSTATIDGAQYDFDVVAGGGGSASRPSTSSATPVTSELAGKVLSVKVKAGQRVSEGDVLLMLEALKMEIEISAPSDGVVAEVAVRDGQKVAAGDVLVAIS
jgi:biotin carboxyl carrier protein